MEDLRRRVAFNTPSGVLVVLHMELQTKVIQHQTIKMSRMLEYIRTLCTQVMIPGIRASLFATKTHASAQPTSPPEKLSTLHFESKHLV